MSHGSPSIHAADGKFQLVGTVAGVDACQLVSDKDEIIVGSALSCDLVIADPLVPRRAFRLKRVRHHVDAVDFCDTHWVLEAFPNSRTYVNGDLVYRRHVAFGDTIALGCHQLSFGPADNEPRDRRANTRIDDLCNRLIQDDEVPSGFLESRPSWINRLRMRKAVAFTTALVAVLAISWLFAPREQQRFEQVQLPMEIDVVSDGAGPPRLGTPVRSLAQVDRQSLAEPGDPGAPTDILPGEARAPQELAVQPLETLATEVAAKPVAPSFSQSVAAAEPNLPTLQIAQRDAVQPKITTTMAKLQGTALTRRLSVEEVSDPAFRQELGPVDIRIANASTGTVVTASAINQWSGGSVARSMAKPTAVKLDSNRGASLAAMERYSSSPVKYENANGVRIPVARLPENLSALSGTGGAGGGMITGVPDGVPNGEVSDAEVAGSWKSGAFKTHSSSPTEANPATFCYVGKIQKQGRTFLSVAFVCKDPNLDQIVTSTGDQGGADVNRDDSIEIFLDTANKGQQYYQMMVNAKGKTWAHVVNNSGKGKYTIGATWSAGQEVTAVINKQAGHWTCKVLIPFDSLGGVPEKGTRWGVNFCRNFRGQGGDDNHYQTWFNVYGGSRNYHNDEKFGYFDW